MLEIGRKTDVNYIIFKFFRLNLVYNFSENLMLYGIIYLLYNLILFGKTFQSHNPGRKIIVILDD